MTAASALTVLTTALAALAGLLVVLAAAIGIRKALGTLVARRRLRIERAIRPQLVAVLAEEGDVAALLRGLPRREWVVVEPMVLGLLTKLRGEAHQRLVALLTERGTLGRMLRRLHRPGAVGRARAAAVLGTAAVPRAADALTRLLSDRDPDVRIVAARALGRTASPNAVNRLLATLDADRAVPAGVVADTIVRIGLDATHALVDALANHSSRAARAVAADVLGLLGSWAAVAALEDALTSASDLETRIRAARALGRIGAPGSTTALTAVLAEHEPPVLRTVAARALGVLGATAAVPYLVPLLGCGRHRLASNAAGALARLGEAGRRALADAAAGDDEDAARYAVSGLAAAALTGGAAAPAIVPTPAG